MDDFGEKLKAKVEVERKRKPFLKDFTTRLVKEKPMGVLGCVIILILVATAIFADLFAPYPRDELHLADAFRASSDQYILGADDLGRDIFSRIIFGSRISLVVGLAGAALCTAVATVIGLVSGFRGGTTDLIVQRVVDAFSCFPPILLYLSIMAVLGAGLWQVILVLGITRGIRQSRVLRGAVISIRENAYVEATRSIGASTMRALYKHILPNIMAPVITLFAISTGYMILTEATISFLGFGIPPPIPSWGGMLSGAGRRYMLQAPWMALWPGLALALVVYGANMLGDAVRDLLDPRLRGGLGRYGRVTAKKLIK